MDLDQDVNVAGLIAEFRARFNRMPNPGELFVSDLGQAWFWDAPTIGHPRPRLASDQNMLDGGIHYQWGENLVVSTTFPGVLDLTLLKCGVRPPVHREARELLMAAVREAGYRPTGLTIGENPTSGPGEVAIEYHNGDSRKFYVRDAMAVKDDILRAEAAGKPRMCFIDVYDVFVMVNLDMVKTVEVSRKELPSGADPDQDRAGPAVQRPVE